MEKLAKRSLSIFVNAKKFDIVISTVICKLLRIYFYIAGIDGVGLGLMMHHHRLGR